MSKNTRTVSKNSLTASQKRQLDRLLEKLAAYLNGPEGAEMMSRLESLFSRIHQQHQTATTSLTSNEARALKFIQKQLKKGCSPSVREVAAELGYRSSRSGLRVIDALIRKGVLAREEDNRLKIKSYMLV